MPRSFRKPCGFPGCAGFSEEGRTRCPKHLTEANRVFNQRRDPQIEAFRNSPAWIKMAARVRLEEPICRLCGQEDTSSVDHIVPVWKAWDRRLDRLNLQGLGQRCHDRKSAAERLEKHRTRVREAFSTAWANPDLATQSQANPQPTTHNPEPTTP